MTVRQLRKILFDMYDQDKEIGIYDLEFILEHGDRDEEI